MFAREDHLVVLAPSEEAFHEGKQQRKSLPHLTRQLPCSTTFCLSFEDLALRFPSRCHEKPENEENLPR